jgi:hypothetical protein
MGLFEWFRRPRPVRPAAVASFDDTEVRCQRTPGVVETVRWDELRVVLIQTTDEGPFVDDIFWVLGGDRSGCVVPSEADGAAELIERLTQLPGFDYNAVIRAMSSTEDRQFICWRRHESE